MSGGFHFFFRTHHQHKHAKATIVMTTRITTAATGKTTIRMLLTVFGCPARVKSYQDDQDHIIYTYKGRREST